MNSEIKPLLRKSELARQLKISSDTLLRLLKKAGVNNKNKNLTYGEVEKVLQILRE